MAKHGIEKPTLAALFEWVKLDKKLMVHVEKDPFHQEKHLYILRKNSIAILPFKIIMGEVLYINLWII